MEDIKVSWFEGYTNPEPQGEVDLRQILFSKKNKDRIEYIRGLEDAEEKRRLKSQLPCFTPSGIFSRRDSDHLLRHSGIICIDIDQAENPDITDWEALKNSLSDMQGLYYAGLSVSGRGLFMLFRLACPEKHPEHFNALERELRSQGIVADAACKDIGRLRTISYDPTPFYNEDAELYSVVEENKSQPKALPVSDDTDLTELRVRTLLERLEAKRIDMVNHYKDWFNVGCALASEFGEQGREFFHIVSRQSDKYDAEKCDKKYADLLKLKENQIHIGTFLYYCKLHGLVTSDEAEADAESILQSRKSFIIYKDMESTFELMAPEDCKKLMLAIFSYMRGEIPSFESNYMLTILFDRIRTQLDRDHEAYLNSCIRNRINGRKGGAPKGNTNGAGRKSGPQKNKPASAGKSKPNNKTKNFKEW